MPLNTSDIASSTLWLTDVVEINRRIKMTLENEAKLSVTQYRLLLELEVNRGHLMCGALATLLFLSPAAVTHAVDGLYRCGHVTRQTMDSNRRVTLVDITEQGRVRLHDADRALVSMLRRDAWNLLTPAEFDTLLASCSAAAGPFVGHTLLHEGVAVEPCYITCAIIQQQCYENLLKSHGFTVNGFRIALLALEAPGGVRACDCADTLLLNRSSTSRAVSDLRRHGVLDAVTCSLDSRASILTLTPQGRAATVEAFDRLAALDASICGAASDARVDELDALGARVHDALRASTTNTRTHQ